MPAWDIDIKRAVVQGDQPNWAPSRPTAQQAAPQTAPQKGSVIILITHRDEKEYREWRSWYNFKFQKPEKTSWRESRGAGLVMSRNSLVLDALKTNSEYFFFLDDDVIGPENGLITLMSLNLPIACGLYWAKKGKKARCLGAWMKNPSGGPGYVAIQGQQKSRHIQVDVTGMGFALIHRSIFERTSQPWFEWPVGGPSEDFWFYEKVWKELQIKPVIDMECRCRHIGIFSIEPDGSFETLGL